MSRQAATAILVFSFLLLVLPPGLAAQDVITANFPRFNWQPTQALPGARYVGNHVCASCHVSEAAHQPSTPMGKALELVGDCAILRRHPDLKVRLGKYSYRIVSRNGGSTYTVTDGTSTFSVPIGWAFGQGEAGQTYVYHYKGGYYESRVSFFNDTQSLDLTLGYTGTHPHDLETAAGRLVSPDDVHDCFSCHATAAVSAGQLQLASMMPGITCEGCHGPGAAHVAAMKAGGAKDPHIFNPEHLDTEDLSDFCGSCHRSWQQVEMQHLQGVVDVRFQPYRLSMSRCFDPTDRRISCTSCHNPHQPLRTNAAFYNSRCLTCHLVRGEAASARKKAAACPVSNTNCISCHMPKYELPGAHYKFTDHYIRIVRAGAPYPY